MEMTVGEKVTVDAAQATADAVNSEGSILITRFYDDVAALPANPTTDGMIVCLTETNAGPDVPGIAMSLGGNWFVFESNNA